MHVFGYVQAHNGLQPSVTSDNVVPCQERTLQEKPRRGPKQLTKSMLVKMHLRKGDAVRVTTPPAPPGTRYDVDLNRQNVGAAKEDALFTE